MDLGYHGYFSRLDFLRSGIGAQIIKQAKGSYMSVSSGRNAVGIVAM